jgi:penicillin-binding protein 1A
MYFFAMQSVLKRLIERIILKIRKQPIASGILVSIGILVFFGTAGVWFVFRLSQNLPTLTQLENIQQPLASRVFDKDGRLVHEFGIERRSFVPLDSIPENMQNAVVAIEDRKFYHHWGMDIRRLLQAAVIDVVRHGYAQGASTLTQQLARNLYLTAKPSMERKIREAMTAVQLETCYTKQQILELYLNQVCFGGGAWGVEAASEQYFSKHIFELNLNECATLAGIIQTPERFRPDKKENLHRCTVRRNTVLRAMVETRAIGSDLCKAAIAEPITIRPMSESSNTGGYFLEMIRKHISDKYGDEMLYNGGLSIYTTIDLSGQNAAEKASASEIALLQARLNGMFLDFTRSARKHKLSREFFLAHFDSLYDRFSGEYQSLSDSIKLRKAQIAVVALDAKTGGIRTLIGGRNFDESKFNRATMALRQPGSAFKPFVYTAAMEHGFSPASVVLDQPVTLQTPEGEWRPENYDHAFHGPTTIRRAVALSVNMVAIQVIMKIGPQTVVDYARRMGFSHDLQAIPSLAVGACEVTPMEMARAYQIFANQGVAVEPYFIEKIVDKSGKILEQHEPESHEVLSPQTTFLMTSLLKTVVCCGTASDIPAMGFTRPAGGKTGTTNDYSDAWFVGFTPQVVCCVWTGVDERRSLGSGVTGAVAAIPVWVPIMVALHRNLPEMDFDMPEGIKTEQLCDESHLIATDACPSSKPDFFLSDAAVDTCPLHGAGRINRSEKKDIFGTTASEEKRKEKKKSQLF